MLKKIFAILVSFLMILCSCSQDPSNGTVSLDSQRRELSEEELAEAMKGANNNIENRPDHNVCYISITCRTAIDSGELSNEMLEILPSDGYILNNLEINYDDGATVFDIILTAVKEEKLHFEYSGTKKVPYIEGVDNLYEFDCGALSGWMYKVNGWFPSFGMGQYKIQPGDQLELIYSCDLGKDVSGGNYNMG